jgi:hypothetical protein
VQIRGSIFHSLFAIISIGLLSSTTPAQTHRWLPPEISENPSLMEIINWLDQTKTFTFDDEEMSEKFNAGFRQAIRLCQPK